MRFLATIAVVIILCTVFVGTIAGAELITYGGVIRETIHSSADLKVKMEDVKIADSTYRQVYAGLFPELKMTGRLERFENLDQGSQGIQSVNAEVIGGDVSSWRSLIYLSGQYELSSWYKKRHEANYYQKLRDAAIENCTIESKKLVKEVTDLYGRLMEGSVRLKYGEEIVRVLEEKVALQEKLLAGGEASREELLRAQTDLENAKKEQTNLSREQEENLVRLGCYTGKVYKVEDNLEIPLLDEAINGQMPEDKLLDSPEIRARMRELDALKTKAKGTSNNYLPDIAFYGRYDFYGSDHDRAERSIREISETGLNVGIMLSIPLFDGGARKWERTRSLQEIRKHQETLKATAEEKRREILTTYLGLRDLSKTLAHYRKLKEQYDRLLLISRKAFALGQRDREDLLEMEKDYLLVNRDSNITEINLAIQGKKYVIESDYRQFMRAFYGNWSCQY